jgi:CTP synthase (UTP-ammonia lyase)
LTVSGGVAGYTFLWNDGDILDPNEDQTDLCAAFYNVLVTDANGCESLLDFTLTEPSPIVVNEIISQFDGIIIAGSFGANGMDGKIRAIKFARENNIPYLGICFGMQMAVIEFARNVLKIKDATSSEIDKKGTFVIGMMNEWKHQKSIKNLFFYKIMSLSRNVNHDKMSACHEGNEGYTDCNVGQTWSVDYH